MAQEIDIFKNPAAIPAHLKNRELNATTKALMGTSMGRRISIRGGVFRMIVGGQEVARSDSRALNIIIVGSSPYTSRHFYMDTYVDGVATKPDCWSNDGIKPDQNCDVPQAHSCAVCPKNIAGSGQGDSRACRYLHRLAVVLENDIDNGEIYELSLAATSLFGQGEPGKMPMQTYMRYLASHGTNATDVVTEMRFDTDVSTPKLTFRAVRFLEIDELALINEYSESQEAQDAVSYNGQIIPPVSTVAQPAKITQPTGNTAPVRAARPSSDTVRQRQAPPAQAPNPEPVVEPRAPRTRRAAYTEPVPEPTMRPSASSKVVQEDDDLTSILNQWGEE